MQKSTKKRIYSLITVTAVFFALFLEKNDLILTEAQNSARNTSQLIEGQNIEAKTLNIGISDGTNLIYMSQEELDDYFSDLNELEIKYVRYDADWSVIQPNNSTKYNWVETDRVVETATRHNIESLIIITYAPGWAQNKDCRDDNNQCPPANNEEFALFAGEVAKRYKSKKVHDFEIWNEPNYGTVKHPRRNAEEYTALLKATYTEIKKINPEANIITGGLAMTGNDGINTAPTDFVISLYTSGAKGYFDGISLHPHTYPGVPQTPFDWNGWKTIDVTRQIMLDNDDADKKIWLTEYGAPTGGPGTKQETGDVKFNYGSDFMSEEAQKEMIEQALESYKEKDYVAALYIHNLKDINDKSTAENFFGLIRTDGSKKPAYDVIQLHT